MSDIYLGTLTALIGVIGTLTAIWFKYYLDREKNKHICIIDQTIREDGELLGKLEDIMSELSADRISIFSFHNGGEYYAGKSMQKLSCSYEVVMPGVSRTQLDLQNIPVSACLTNIRPLINDKEYHCYDVKRDYPESFCKYKLTESGVKSVYQFAIFDLNKNAIGIIRADYITKKVKLTKEVLETLHYLAIKLPGYLTK